PGSEEMELVLLGRIQPVQRYLALRIVTVAPEGIHRHLTRQTEQVGEGTRLVLTVETGGDAHGITGIGPILVCQIIAGCVAWPVKQIEGSTRNAQSEINKDRFLQFERA